MKISARIRLLLTGLVLLGPSGNARAQTRPGPGAGGWPGSDSSRSAYATGRAYSPESEAAVRRSPVARGRRPSAYTRGTVGVSSGAADRKDDPLRPFSEQARRRASAVSPTRPAEAPAPPPQPLPQYRRNYYPEMRPGALPNSNIHRIRSHCIPSRSSVISGRVAGAY